MSWSSRAFVRWTMWLTANGAAGRSGFARSCAASASLISASHASSAPVVRALSAGKEPIMPAWHWAITRAGLDMMNIGDAITGSRRRPLRISGNANSVAPGQHGYPGLVGASAKAQEGERDEQGI